MGENNIFNEEDKYKQDKETYKFQVGMGCLGIFEVMYFLIIEPLMGMELGMTILSGVIVYIFGFTQTAVNNLFIIMIIMSLLIIIEGALGIRKINKESIN